MTLERLDNVLVVVEDLERVTAFLLALGMELEGETTVEGPAVDATVGLDGAVADIAMLTVPGGHGRVELTRYRSPAAVRLEPEDAPSNALGLRRVMFAVTDLDGTLARLRDHGAELVGDVADYEGAYRLCFVRGPEGLVVGLAERQA
jgi:catechol 2,3-dioxygenase-like lactoylglutathione lyase family enzyme